LTAKRQDESEEKMLLNEFYAGLEEIGFLDSGFRHTVAGHELRSYEVPERLRSILVSVNVGVACDRPVVILQDAQYREVGFGYHGHSKTPTAILMRSPDEETLAILNRDAEFVGFWLDARPLFKVQTASDEEIHEVMGTRLGTFDVDLEISGG
jgi:hypothetical protein